MYLRMLHVPFWLWHSLILTLPLPIASNMEISVHCEEFSYFDFSGILLLLWPAYYSIWVSNDCQGLCICSFNPNTFYHSVGCSVHILSTWGTWLWLTFVHFCHVSCWPVGYPGTCIHYVCFSALWQLHHLHSLCNHSLYRSWLMIASLLN